MTDLQHTRCLIYADAIAKAAGITRDQLYSRKRNDAVARPRMALMAVLRDRMKLTLMEIGGHLHRDHTTVIHAVKTVKEFPEFLEYWHAAIMSERKVESQSEYNPALRISFADGEEDDAQRKVAERLYPASSQDAGAITYP